MSASHQYRLNLDRRSFIRLGASLRIASLAGGSLAQSGRSAPMILHRDDSDFESWRRAMPWQDWVADRHPHSIARPDSLGGVCQAVKYAREQSSRIAVKSCGHNVSESFLRDNGVLLDLGLFRDCTVDQQHKRVTVGPSLWGRNLMLELAPARLAFPVAHCATVGMGGYLLGGGIGVNTDVWDVGCQSIIGAQVVLGNANVYQVDDATDPDLMWAIRGAGTGFFGAITAYTLACKPLPRDIRETTLMFPFDQAPRVARWLQDKVTGGLECSEIMILLAHNPMAQADAAAGENKICIARVVHFGDSEAQNRDELARIMDHPLPPQALMTQTLIPSSIEDMMIGSVNAAMGMGFGRSAVNTVWTNDCESIISRLQPTFVAAPSSKSHVVVSIRANTSLAERSCFSRIDHGFVGAYGVWDDQADDQANFDWSAKMADVMEGGSSGCYINELDAFAQPHRLRDAFSVSALQKLRMLRKRYDPDNVFHDFPGIT